MEELLKAYLETQREYYVEPLVIRDFDTMIQNDETVYVVKVNDMCEMSGYDNVEVSVSDLLVFLYARGSL